MQCRVNIKGRPPNTDYPGKITEKEKKEKKEISNDIPIVSTIFRYTLHLQACFCIYKAKKASTAPKRAGATEFILTEEAAPVKMAGEDVVALPVGTTAKVEVV